MDAGDLPGLALGRFLARSGAKVGDQHREVRWVPRHGEALDDAGLHHGVRPGGKPFEQREGPVCVALLAKLRVLASAMQDEGIRMAGVVTPQPAAGYGDATPSLKAAAVRSSLIDVMVIFYSVLLVLCRFFSAD